MYFFDGRAGRHPMKNNEKAIKRDMSGRCKVLVPHFFRRTQQSTFCTCTNQKSETSGERLEKKTPSTRGKRSSGLHGTKDAIWELSGKDRRKAVRKPSDRITLFIRDKSTDPVAMSISKYT
jgi:hypothetical protein